jgi:glycosyltransferase involved in cell wall biosynthesis
MSVPFFSIIIPCRNAAATIARTIASVQQQSERNRELIVVDGASTDGTRELLERAADASTRVVSEPDAGIYAAMNKGARLAGGTWLLFLGADDVFAGPEVLARVRAAIGSTDSGVFCGEAAYADGRIWPIPVNPRVRFRNFLHHQACFYHRSCFATRGYDERLRTLADYDFNLRLWQAGIRPVAMSVRVAVCSSGGLSDSGAWSNYREEIAIRHRHFPAWQCWGWDTIAVARCVAKRLRRR